jgi:hypothetical protein
VADYRYHVFLSYRRASSWLKVVRIIHECLEHHLQTTLGGNDNSQQIRVFRDDHEVDYGAEWPLEIAEALASSTVLVPVLWSEYFANSHPWCQTELGLMRARRDAIRNSAGHCPPLIFPIKIYDCPLPHVGDIQTLDVSNIVTPMMTKNSQDGKRLWRSLEGFSKDIANTLSAPPALDSSWAALAYEPCEQLFTVACELQRDLPTLGAQE